MSGGDIRPYREPAPMVIVEPRPRGLVRPHRHDWPGPLMRVLRRIRRGDRWVCACGRVFELRNRHRNLFLDEWFNAEGCYPYGDPAARYEWAE